MTEPAAQVGVHEAKTQLSRLLRLVDASHELEILRNGEPVARLVPAGPPAVRVFGVDRDRFVVPDDFAAAADVLERFTPVISYLLDTHVWLCSQTTPERLGDEVGQLLADRTHTLLLSAASSWEIAITYRLGKRPLPEPPAEYVPHRMRLSGVTPAPIEHAHALRVADLPDHHDDPFDRLLVAQAQVLAGSPS